jgi:NADH-quinone oxidoreductase subunit K
MNNLFFLNNFYFNYFYFLIPIILIIFGIWSLNFFTRNYLFILISLELILLGINLIFCLSSIYLDDFVGQLFALFILTIIAAESALGLALLVIFYRLRNSISNNLIIYLKG